MKNIEYLNAVADILPSPALVIGHNGKILTMNESAVDVLGADATNRDYVVVLRQPLILEAIEAVLADGQPRETRYLGRVAPVATTYQAAVRALTTPADTHVLVILTDISQAEAVGQMRRDFVANVSHELRTPLTALMGFIETLRGPARNDNAAADHFLGLMEVEAERMNRLIQDLLSLSRVESEERMRPGQQVDIVALVHEAAQIMEPIVQSRGQPLQIIVEAPEDPLIIPGDEDQLMQVFSNLLENALKYGADRDVTIRLTQAPRDPVLRRPAVAIDVCDQGDGIEALHVPRLTERFYRVDSHRGRAEGGTGLGLAIVKHIIGRHRGRLRIQSTPGKGSTFQVLLPQS